MNKTLLGFDSCAAYLRRAHCVVTGTPVRRGLERIDRAVAAEKFGLNPALPIVLIASRPRRIPSSICISHLASASKRA